MNGTGLVKQMNSIYCCFCCWHYSPTQQKCIYWGANGLRVSADDDCHFPDKDAFNNICEFKDMEDKQWIGDIGGTLP